MRILKDYQEVGVNWMWSNYSSGHGSILADEMGLGKTYQVIKFLDRVISGSANDIKVLVLCPLSVVDSWSHEVTFSSKTSQFFTAITGSQDERLQKYEKVFSKSGTVVLLTNYETVINDCETILQFTSKWDVLIVDEAHRLKNSASVLHEILHSHFLVNHCVLITGTPIQNNLNELYSLLSLVDGAKFPIENAAQFVESSPTAQSAVNGKSTLHETLKKYVLRRTKKDVAIQLPPKSEVTIFHGLTSIQKKLYKSLLLKDSDTLSSLTSQLPAKRTSLNNILCQLKKCCLHPYLFQGVEPEPFVMGDHLILASQKLVLLDKLLDHVLLVGHKILIFSQYTSMLDILQDYLEYKRLNYERLDGSCRSEERFMSIKNFNNNTSTCVFLLSTRAGGQGINLTSADTVIFTDCDFNPQNDVQAAARAHRIGQQKPVKIIKLICKNSVEEVIIARAKEKMKLSSGLLDTGLLTGEDSSENGSLLPNELSEVVKYGLDVILSNLEATDDLTIDFDQILGSTDSQGCWKEVEKLPEDLPEREVTEAPETIYDFEGENYKLKMKKSEELLAKIAMEEAASSVSESSTFVGGKRKRTLTAEEMKANFEVQKELIAKRAKIAEEQRLEREEKRKKRLKAKWQEAGYESCKLPTSDDSHISQNGHMESEDDSCAIQFVSGDVTQPLTNDGAFAVVIHCVDNSGRWGEGGLFSALDRLSPEIGNRYELAAEMKDLTFGDTHVIKLDNKSIFVALIVSQKRNSKGVISEIDVKVLDKSFEQIAAFVCDERKNGKTLSIHTPRLGNSMKAFNWYCAERLLKKHFVSIGVETLVYYFSRSRKRMIEADNSEIDEVPQKSNEQFADEVSSCGIERPSMTSKLPSLFSGRTFAFSTFLDSSIKSELQRYIIAYDGDVSDDCPDLSSDKDTFYISAQNELVGSEIRKSVSVAALLHCIRSECTKPLDELP